MSHHFGGKGEGRYFPVALFRRFRTAILTMFLKIVKNDAMENRITRRKPQIDRRRHSTGDLPEIILTVNEAYIAVDLRRAIACTRDFPGTVELHVHIDDALFGI